MSWFFLIIGLPYSIIGLAERDKWGKEVELARRKKVVLALRILLAVLVAVAIAVFLSMFFRYVPG
jgi:hypothetical protein